MSATDSTAPQSHRQLWNHRIHQRWAGEDLTFWRLAFFPKYDPKAIVPLLHDVMRDLGVHSYTIYETLGLFDLFVRAWLPGQTMERVDQTLNDALAGESMQLCEPFTVSKILRHWAWDDGNGGLYEPSAELLNKPWNAEQIGQIDRGEIPNERVQELDDDHVLRQITSGAGIKFLIIITSSVYSPTYNARQRLSKGLLEVLNKHDIEERSLYEGSGFGQFLLMGRVAADKFFTLQALATEINETGLQDTARPYTFVSSREGLVFSVDRLPTSETGEAEPFDIEELLTKDEGQTLEVKGSASLNWARYLVTDEPLKPDKKVLNDGLIKAIVGMLNADGGHIVIGALERAVRIGELRIDEHPKLKKFPTRGDYLCVGINDEYDERRWDSFRLHLLEMINTRVEPPPAGSIGLTRHKIEDRDLCVVTVKPTSATWYYRYLGEGQPVKFFVREDAQTIAFEGTRADAYRRSRPRG